MVTAPVARATLHWTMADAALARHRAHLSVAGSAETGSVLSLACDFTKAIAALLPVTDSMAVCWLNGPALTSAESFVGHGSRNVWRRSLPARIVDCHSLGRPSPNAPNRRHDSV